jgi:hypothetical protein
MSAPEHRPAPLVPESVNLAGNEWFPLYFDRLRKSRWWRRASDLARARNIMLWGAAYASVPAGSLPDDDDELADAAGFGFDAEAFIAVKAEVLAPWVLCSDGRWYHPTVCEQALEAWGRVSERRQQGKARQAAYRQRVRQLTEAAPSGSRVTPPEVTRHTREQDRTGQDIEQETVASALPLATVGGSQKGLSNDREPWKAEPAFLAVWNGATPQMQRRAKSRGKAWAEWVKVRHLAEPGAILAALRAYRAGDPDVARTGGPGLHIWLRDRTFETWATGADDPATGWTAERWAIALELWKADPAKWGETMGPPPGQPGCRVPQSILAAAGLGLRIVGGAA